MMKTIISLMLAVLLALARESRCLSVILMSSRGDGRGGAGRGRSGGRFGGRGGGRGGGRSLQDRTPKDRLLVRPAPWWSTPSVVNYADRESVAKELVRRGLQVEVGGDPVEVLRASDALYSLSDDADSFRGANIIPETKSTPMCYPESYETGQ